MASTLEVVTTWTEFQARHHDPARKGIACRLAGDLRPFAWKPVDALALLAEAIADPRTRILSQPPGDRLDLSADIGAHARSLPIERLACEPHLHASLFDLTDLRRPGRVLHCFSEEVIRPLEQLWHENGVRWQGEFWPILFIGGAQSATNYHIDPTPNAIFHLSGEKRFWSLRDPERWCPEPVRDAYRRHGVLATRPPGIREGECLSHDNAPGDLVWIPQLTPHWVEAGSLSATITFAFRDFGIDRDALPGGSNERRQIEMEV